MPVVLVTGANGLLATNLIAELLSKGYSVKGILRNINEFRGDKPQALELVKGDFTNMDFIRNELVNCDYVVHAAAMTGQGFSRYKDYRKVNAEATGNLVQAAVAEKVKRFIYISTANTIGYGTSENPGDESRDICKPFTGSFYAMSKLEGEKIVLSSKDQIEVIILNPSFMLGAFGSKHGSGRLVLSGYHKKVIFYPEGGKSFVHVQDVAKAVVAALDKGRHGEKYLITNENLSFREFYHKLSLMTNNHPFYIRIPRLVFILAGWFGYILRLAGFSTELTPANMKSLCSYLFYSNQKAKTELDIEFQPVEKAIEDAVEWFRENKMCC